MISEVYYDLEKNKLKGPEDQLTMAKLTALSNLGVPVSCDEDGCIIDPELNFLDSVNVEFK